ncbi:MAG: hypothetical protein JKX81_17745 [Arenicella sp.]|nr:hypothetical protein [Arenicella sp.]
MHLVTLNDWKYDTPPKDFGKTAFYYDLDIAVMFQGETIATHNLKGKRIVKSIKLINEDYAWIYESIFDSSGIRNAFSENYSPSQLGKATPSALETTPVNAAGVKSKVSKPKNVQSRGDPFALLTKFLK